jgi:hypothetical protein
MHSGPCEKKELLWVLLQAAHYMKRNGRGERIRTSDPLVPNQVLYQAEPLPELAIGRQLTDPKSSWLNLRTRP